MLYIVQECGVADMLNGDISPVDLFTSSDVEAALRFVIEYQLKYKAVNLQVGNYGMVTVFVKPDDLKVYTMGMDIKDD